MKIQSIVRQAQSERLLRGVSKPARIRPNLESTSPQGEIGLEGPEPGWTVRLNAGENAGAKVKEEDADERRRHIPGSTKNSKDQAKRHLEREAGDKIEGGGTWKRVPGRAGKNLRGLEIPQEDRSPKVSHPGNQKWSTLMGGENP